MKNRNLELKEAINRAHRRIELLERENLENSLLLTGLKGVLEANSQQELYSHMFQIFGKIIPYESAFVLEQSEPGKMRCKASTVPDFLHLEWTVDPVLKRSASGKPCAVYSTSRQPAWREHKTPHGSQINSALYCPFSGPERKAIIVFCHSLRGFYIQDHVDIALRYQDFTEQALLSVDAKLKALESHQLRLEKERIEKSLVQSDKMASLGLLAAGVAHELNNPLSYVSSNMSYLKSTLADLQNFNEQFTEIHQCANSGTEDQLRNKINDVHQWRKEEALDEVYDDLEAVIVDCEDGLRRAQDIVNGLRNFTRVDDSGYKPVDINQCIQTALKLVSNELKYHCNLDVALGDTDPVMASEGKLNQVLTNLLVNAGHAITDKGTITIRSGITETQDNGPCSWFSVRDNGCGIPEEQVAHIFDPFYTSKPVGKGTGLGLSISYSIIKKFSGSITVESDLNVGTCFTVFLPVASQ